MQTTNWHHGDSPEELRKYGWYVGSGTYGTRPVGLLQPNAFGLFDMHGNVWESCADNHTDDYYSRSPVEDPRGPTQDGFYVRRGGGWNHFAIHCRSAYRFPNHLQAKPNHYNGVRVAASIRSSKSSAAPP
ncbi:MAG: hypothetical protein B7Z55_06665 [Planctomycetales bacterium 12-60-4]|nr:MAG: hypothetical protein B7Z55_06665 [Planctomycetales bacterium 12-60-4]